MVWDGEAGENARAGRPSRLGMTETGCVPLLVVPLRLRDQGLGAIIASGSVDGVGFSSRQQDILMTLAAHAAVSIDNTRLFEEVQRLAITDDLTQAFNRRHLFEVGEHELQQAKRYERSLSAIMFDIDHFKAINDTYGHAAGDEVLRWFADQCRRAIRRVDILGRYGGEEFAVLLPETNLKGAFEIAERIRNLVNGETVETSKGPLEVTVSAGVAEIHHGMTDVHTLIDRADAAMYFAKRTGRNRVEGG
jgi:diguanylate cyclase (GGDEF)-like protein